MKLPAGWEEIDFYLVLKDSEVEYFEQTVLFMLIRDYHFLYEKRSDYLEGYKKIHFYSKPSDAFSIVYHIGFLMHGKLYNQSYFSIQRMTHVVPKPFPQSIHLTK